MQFPNIDRMLDRYFNGVGFWSYGIRARELVIKNFLPEITPDDNLITTLAKTSINTLVRASTITFPFLPNCFKYIELPYCAKWGFITNAGLCFYKAYQAVHDKNLDKLKEAALHGVIAAADFYAIQYLPGILVESELLNKIGVVGRNGLLGVVSCLTSVGYTIAGAITDLTKVTSRIHNWMFPNNNNAPHVPEPVHIDDNDFGGDVPELPAAPQGQGLAQIAQGLVNGVANGVAQIGHGVAAVARRPWMSIRKSENRDLQQEGRVARLGERSAPRELRRQSRLSYPR